MEPCSDEFPVRKKLDPPLSPLQFRFLLVLYQNAGRVCDNQAIASTLWPDQKLSKWTIETIQNLATEVNTRLKELNTEHEYIVTVQEQGFMFDQE